MKSRYKIKHGQARRGKKTLEYQMWRAMKTRCLNPNCEAYKNYGGRGISVCNRWHSFENFYADVGPKPEDLTLERRNNDGDYEPSNCKWATWMEQANNRRLPKMIKLNKKPVHPLRAWRTSQGLIQTEVAIILGYLTPGIIHAIETYKVEPKIGEVLLLCELSGGVLSPEDFKDVSRGVRED